MPVLFGSLAMGGKKKLSWFFSFTHQKKRTQHIINKSPGRHQGTKKKGQEKKSFEKKNLKSLFYSEVSILKKNCRTEILFVVVSALVPSISRTFHLCRSFFFPPVCLFQFFFSFFCSQVASRDSLRVPFLVFSFFSSKADQFFVCLLRSFKRNGRKQIISLFLSFLFVLVWFFYLRVVCFVV